MSDRYTESIDPYALATQGRLIEGKVALADLKRVLPLLRSSNGEVVFSLNFDIDEMGMPRIRGKVQATLSLQCQRCMEDMEFPVLSRVRLGIVPSREAAKQIPDNYDPLVSDDETSIVSIIEDELILALPIVAMHKIEDCPQGDTFIVKHDGQAGDRPTDVGTGKESPFSVLAKLKSTQSEDKAEK